MTTTPTPTLTSAVTGALSGEAGWQSWRCRQVDGSHPGGFLTGLGLALLLDGQVWFDDRCGLWVRVPADQADHAMEEAGRRLVAWSTPEQVPAWEVFEPATVNMAWTDLERPCRDSWHDEPTARLVADVDVGSYAPQEVAHPRASASSLTMVSGTVRPRRTTLRLLAALDDPADQLRRLVTGQPLAMVESSGLRLTSREPAARVRSARQSWVAPVADLVAHLGAGCLQPQQLVTSPRGMVDGLAWVLNPMPLSLRVLVDVHEQRLRPAGWAAFTCRIASPEGSKDAQKNFVEVREDL